MELTSAQITLVVVFFIFIAGVWLTILTYVLLSKKRRKPEELVNEIKKALTDEQNKAAIVPLLNEMLEGETNKNRKRKIKTIKSKAKKIDVSDIAELMGELDTLILECGDYPEPEEKCNPEESSSLEENMESQPEDMGKGLAEETAKP